VFDQLTSMQTSIILNAKPLRMKRGRRPRRDGPAMSAKSVATFFLNAGVLLVSDRVLGVPVVQGSLSGRVCPLANIPSGIVDVWTESP
jgi:hypothetical protein